KADGTPDETCKNGHGVEGICATDAPDGSTHDDDGKIHLNFQYAMSQVVVQLKTNPDASSTNKVTFDEKTKVEILNGYTEGALMLGDGSSDFSNYADKNQDYTMHNETAGNYTNYRDAIVPQSLTSPAGDLKFRITVGDDAYETVLGIKDIPVTIGGKKQKIDAWKPGKKYVYTLTITKTGVTVAATIADWDTVTADTPIWM
ncbi:MAG: fimbrillin family protein, partial [Alloprevotella sp.]|nr:fimbrillin family protein [Alloprevotella sp.]